MQLRDRTVGNCDIGKTAGPKRVINAGAVVAILALAVLWSGSAGLPGRGEAFGEDAGISEAARSAGAKYEKDIDTLRSNRAAMVDASRSEFIQQVDQLISIAKDKGDLDGVVALTEERDAASRKSGPGKAKNAAVVTARRNLDQAIRKADASFKSAAEQAHAGYLLELEQLEKDETKAGRIDAAKAIRELRQTVEKRGPPALDSAAASGRGSGGDWIDLMEWSEGIDWLPRGVDWQAQLESPPTKAGITTKQVDGWSWFPLPAIVRGEYELEVEFTSPGGQELGVTLPVDGHSPVLVLGAGAREDSFSPVDGIWISGNETTKSPTLLRAGQRHKLRSVVTRQNDQWSVNVSVDAQPGYIQWVGPSWRLIQQTPGAPASIPDHPGIGSFRSSATFHSARIRKLSGSIQRAFRTEADKKEDLNRGEFRLTESPPFNVRVGWSQLGINQIPGLGSYHQQTHWPLLSRPFRACTDYYGAHAPCRIQVEIPEGAESFSVIGTNESSAEAKFLVLIDGKPVYESGQTPLAIIRIDIPAMARKLELVTDPLASNDFDRTYWCYPRFHAVSAEKIPDKSLDDRPGKLKFVIAGATGSPVTRNKPIAGLQSAPVHFRDAEPCHEFLYCHAPSDLTFAIPRGMTRFTGVGYNVVSHSTRFEVWSGKQMLYRSPPTGIQPVDVRFPQGATEFTLRVDPMGDPSHDHAFWCYPRLHRR